MLTREMFRITPNEFWQVQLHERSLLTKKQPEQKLIYLLLLRWFEKYVTFPTNYKDDQESSMLCLHLLQTCISYVNTLLIENILADNHWQSQLSDEDHIALTALFYSNINPYGTFELDLNQRLSVGGVRTGEPQ